MRLASRWPWQDEGEKKLSTINEITTDAIHILCKEIGVVDTIRFINQFTTGYGNYAEERDTLFGDMALHEVIARIKEMKGNG